MTTRSRWQPPFTSAGHCGTWATGLGKAWLAGPTVIDEPVFAAGDVLAARPVRCTGTGRGFVAPARVWCERQLNQRPAKASYQ